MSLEGKTLLWPRTLIATAAAQNLLGGQKAMSLARKPELYADAAVWSLGPQRRDPPRLGIAAYVKAPMPVISRPTIRVCMVSVPSKV